VIALESARANCLVVGEDLGTAPDGLRPALERTRVYSYKVLSFEREGEAFLPPADYPERALACVATHDLPPLAGWWTGADLDERFRLELADAASTADAHEQRADDRAALLEALAAEGLIEEDEIDASAPLSDSLAAAIHAYVARSPSLLVLAQAEDLAGQMEGVNMPGTHEERANWRLRLRPSLDQLWDSPRCSAILAAMKAASEP
jgi:glycogen operon protein